MQTVSNISYPLNPQARESMIATSCNLIGVEINMSDRKPARPQAKTCTSTQALCRTYFAGVLALTCAASLQVIAADIAVSYLFGSTAMFAMTLMSKSSKKK